VGKVRIGLHLRFDWATERILIDVVETLDTDNAVINEHSEKKEEETAELEVRPITPDLTKAWIRTNDDIEDEEVGDPDASATETFKNSSKNCRSVLSHEHTKEVIAKDNRGVEDTSAKDVTVVEEHVKSLKSLLTSIILRDVSGEAKKDGARDGTPETFKTDNKNRIKIDLLKKELLNDNLRSLDDLSENDKSATKSNLSSGVSLLFGLIAGRHRAAAVFAAAASLRKFGAVKGSESDNEKSESDNANTNPMRSMKLTFKEEL